MIQRCIAGLLLTTICIGCNPCAYKIDPCLSHELSEQEIQNFPSSFEPLSSEERQTEWGRELLIADQFGHELDLYRAITGYKRALVLIPKDHPRRSQIEYDILYSYYIAGKYCEAIKAFEESSLPRISNDFPAFRDLLIILFFSYNKTNNPYRRDAILNLIRNLHPELAQDLDMSVAITTGNLNEVYTLEHRYKEGYRNHFCNFERQKLSVKKAQVFNALLPGAGYLYTGQKRTALTAFILNAAFITAAYELFNNGYPAAGVIVSSLEFGWYFGGINGAGLSAKYYNDQIYNCYAKEAMEDQRLFPALMLQKAF